MSGSGFSGDGRSIALGCIVGLVGGLGLGLCIVVLLGGFTQETSMIVVMHTSLAMMIMGGWTAPSLMPESEPSAAATLRESVATPEGNLQIKALDASGDSID